VMHLHLQTFQQKSEPDREKMALALLLQPLANRVFSCSRRTYKQLLWILPPRFVYFWFSETRQFLVFLLWPLLVHIFKCGFTSVFSSKVLLLIFQCWRSVRFRLRPDIFLMIKIQTPMMIIIGNKLMKISDQLLLIKKLKSCNLPSLTALSNLFCNIWSLPMMNV
jgi:hypothetical protein